MWNEFFGEDGTKKVSKWVALSLMFLSAFLLVQVITSLKRLPSAGREVYPQSTITVNGEGESFAVPDIASFTFSVSKTSDSINGAQEVVGSTMKKVVDLAKEAGVKETDIKTTSYNAYPKYEWSQPQCIVYPCPSGKNILVGYEVSQTVMIKVRDTGKVGELVSKVGSVEDITNISGVEFTVDDKEKYVKEARENAIKKAKEQAKATSKQLGVRLGRMLYFSEVGNYMPTPYAEGMGGGGDVRMSMAIEKAVLPKGESKIVSQVNITYELK